MPIYEYKCTTCGFQKEFLRKVSDPAETDCPSCGKPTFTKMVTAAGFQLKGTGWYVTDFRNSGAGKPAESSAGKSGGASTSPDAGANTGGAAAAESGAAAGTKTDAGGSATTSASSSSDTPAPTKSSTPST